MKWLLAKFGISFLTKWLLPIAIGVAVVGLGSSHLWMYQSGKKAERQAQELRLAQSLLRAAVEAERIRSQDISFLMESRDREIQIIREIRTVRVDVPTPECVDLGPDWVREANKAIAASNLRGISSR